MFPLSVPPHFIRYAGCILHTFSVVIICVYLPCIHLMFNSSLQSFLACNLFPDCLFPCALSIFCIELTLFHSHFLTLECFLVSALTHCKVSLSLSLLFSSKFSVLILSLIQFPAIFLCDCEGVVLYLDKYCMLKQRGSKIKHTSCVHVLHFSPCHNHLFFSPSPV